MRNLERNKQPISFLNYLGTEDLLDSKGFLTGEKKVKYTPSKQIKAHVSGAKGSSMIEVFGTDIAYDKIILLTKKEVADYGITENTVFFIDVQPAYENGVPLYDYRVKRIATTINEVLIAIVKVGQNANKN